MRSSISPSDADIEAALEAGARAQEAWKRVPLAERSAICRRMAALMVARADDIGTELAWQIGRPITQSPFEIRRGFQERARYMSTLAERSLADVVLEPNDGPALHSPSAARRRARAGAVELSVPRSVNTVVPAMVAGNSVVLKTAQPDAARGRAVHRGVRGGWSPAGVFQYLHRDHADLAADHRRSTGRYVSFTGSVDVGDVVQQAAGGRFIATDLELGGKDPAYVRPDAPSTSTIANLVDGSFFNAGQSCCGVERIYVHRGTSTTRSSTGSSPHPRLSARRSARSGDLARPDGRARPRPRSCAIRSPRPFDGRSLADRLGWVSRGSRRHAVRGAAGARRRRSLDAVMSEETFGPVVGHDAGQ